MVELSLIGIGAGNSDHLTREAAAAIQAADRILIPRKGAEKSDLAELRRDICRSVLGDKADDRIIEFDLPVRETDGAYLAGVDDWHDRVAESWGRALRQGGGAERAAFLIWGDPSLYDSSLRIAERLSPKPKLRVIPGITALQALTAAHAIPLNEIGAAVTITTGRLLRETGWPAGVKTAAIMLDGQCSFQSLVGAYQIWWGAYLGMPEQILFHGVLAEVQDGIIAERAEARRRHGWIMDIYLLRRM